MTETEVAVLGGGLQGSAVALELASNGIRVDLYERETECMSQASAQNECEIHLGYVFANDPSLATARILSKGTFGFAPLMPRRSWLFRVKYLLGPQLDDPATFPSQRSCSARSATLSIIAMVHCSCRGVRWECVA